LQPGSIRLSVSCLIVKSNMDIKITTLAPSRNEFWISMFCKALYLFVLLKIVFSWEALESILVFSPFNFYSWKLNLLYAPLVLLKVNLKFFLLTFLGILLISIYIRLNYISAILIFWFSISLSRLLLPVFNGSDLVLSLFLFIAIFLPDAPKIKLPVDASLQDNISRWAVMLIRVELALIYFLSGYDKLMSDAWQSGAAVYSIINLNFYYNSLFSLQLSESQFLVISWITVLFELVFPLGVWFEKTRPYFLIAGIIFHLTIIIFLGLIDFGVLMIISYLIFLPFKDRKTSLA
jgi:hypothetical protein